MTKETNIHFLLDRSGSMYDCLTDTIGGFNSFITSQRDDNSDDCYMSFYMFDHKYEIVYLNKPIRDVQELNTTTFVPRGQTALFDAIGQTISSVNAMNNENVNVIVVILTDGQENSSTEFSSSKIKQLISDKEKEGWKFVFLGANQDAITTAGYLGIQKGSAMTYAQTSNGVRNTFKSLSSAVSRARRGAEVVNFTDQERICCQMN